MDADQQLSIIQDAIRQPSEKLSQVQISVMDNTQTQPIPHLSIMNDEQKELYENYNPSVDLSAAHTDNTFDITQRKDVDRTVNSHQALSVRKYQPPGADETTEKGSEDN